MAKDTTLMTGILIGAAVVAIAWTVKTFVLDKRQSREGFQEVTTVTGTTNLTPDLVTSPETCGLMKSVRDRTVGLLEKAQAAKDETNVKLLTTSVDSITAEMNKMNCAL